MKTESYIDADEAIEKYRLFCFQSAGRGGFDDNKANALAATAFVCCEIASDDYSLNDFTRNHYLNDAKFFLTQIC